MKWFYVEDYKSYSQDPKRLGNSVLANTWLHGIPNQNACGYGCRISLINYDTVASIGTNGDSTSEETGAKQVCGASHDNK